MTTAPSTNTNLRVLEGLIQANIRKGSRALMAIAALFGINAVAGRTLRQFWIWDVAYLVMGLVLVGIFLYAAGRALVWGFKKRRLEGN